MTSLSPPNSRTLVLCFDGTDEKFQPNYTNVIRLFNALEKDSRDQLVYYQPGIGTYVAPGVMAGIQNWVAKLVDQAVAWYLDIHIMGGYDFLMQNYRDGDRICMFGFSRGAYTARALAGMLYKVGLLPRGNVEQAGLAYNIYKQTSNENTKLAAQFKETFSKSVSIEFVGCWETVSSVGVLYSRSFPFTDDNSSIKYFRHALALDEHRARFQPNLYHRSSPSAQAASKDPQHASSPSSGSGPSTDVLEVWFAGCHTDIGGGATLAGRPSLSGITFRWMIRQIVTSKCGVRFNSDALAAENIPLSMFSPSEVAKARFGSETSDDSVPAPLYSPQAAKADSVDATQPLHDPLILLPIWWILEILPFVVSWQDESGVWHRSWRWNLGRPRKIYTSPPKLHITVKERIDNAALKYTPRAVWGNKPDAVWCH